MRHVHMSRGRHAVWEPPVVTIGGQTEDCFLSLTQAVAGLMDFHGIPHDRDHIGAVTGDWFAWQLEPTRRATGMADGCGELLDGLADLGFSPRLPVAEISEDTAPHLAAVLVGALGNARPALACGGWRAPAGERDGTWGVIYHYAPETSTLAGATMADDLVDRSPSRDLAWLAHTGTARCVILPGDWAAPSLAPSHLARRVFERGFALLSADESQGGPAFGALLSWLRSPIPADSAELRNFPHPLLTAVRCQLEALARYARAAVATVPARKHRELRVVQDLARSAGELLLDHEPRRTQRRASGRAAKGGSAPWVRGAWQERAQALATFDSPVRGQYIAVIEELRERHRALVEALDAMLAK